MHLEGHPVQPYHLPWMIQIALEQGGALECLKHIDDIIVWDDTAEVGFEKKKKIVQILKTSSAVNKNKVTGDAIFMNEMARWAFLDPNRWD